MATVIRAAAVFLCVSLFASAQSFWDGNAATQRGDAGFESGAFAASNSFPEDTEIVVENLETGRTARAVVSQRISGQSDLLVLLSPKAAAELGLSQGRIASVRVTVKTPSTAVGETLPAELALSQDPDINPAAGILALQPPRAAEPRAAVSPVGTAEAPAQPLETAEVPAEPFHPNPSAGQGEAPGLGDGAVEGLQPAGREPRTLLAQAPTPEPAPEAGESAPAAVEPAQVAEAPADSGTRAEAPAQTAAAPAFREAPPEQKPDWKDEILRLASRSPQKQLFLPPREDEKFFYQKPVQPPPQETLPEQNPIETPAVLAPVPEDVKTEETLGVPTLPKKPEARPFSVAEYPVPSAGELPAPDVPDLNSLPGLFPPPRPKPDLTLAEAGFPIEMNPEVTERLASKEDTGQPIALTPPEPQPAGETPGEAPPLAAEVSGPAPTPPKAAEVETLVALEPAPPKPPPEHAQPAVVAEKPAEKPPEEVKPAEKPAEKQPVSPSVALHPAGKQPPGAVRPPGKKAAFVIQLAAYASEKQARDTAAGLARVYPVNVVLQDGKANPLFRLQVGPLNKAESGTLLLWFRYRGFPDAFIKAAD